MPPVTSLDLSLPEAARIETIDGSLPSLFIPNAVLAHLKTFTLKCDWEGNNILTTLQSCTNLENLTLDFDSDDGVMFDEDEFNQALSKDGLVLPKLRTLRFRHVLEEQVCEFLDLLNAPELEELDICGRYWDDSEKYDARNWDGHILAATKRGGCTLRRLRIHFVTFENKELYNLLSNLPSLERLCLENVTFDLTIFRSLKSGECLPNLEVLELLDLPTSEVGNLEYSLLHEFFLDSIPSVFRKRRGIEPKISSVKRLRLVLREPQPLDLRPLERGSHQFKRDGMEVSISSIPYDTYDYGHY
ncbi:hypothetical protein EST38_g2339 [Candolleomyces aberdarensis]|uniref:Uncharacterized protein n=1 Tax=Candolleomyces aberdarensis TaxID=2316362 RepID=A0A4Q2DVS1_9AGAR|nr:hypothetical protein EST38_g2339 [Candolleomyces aberdarensis]